MLPILAQVAQKADLVKVLVNENSTTILTAVGVSGTAVTAYLTGHSSFKAAEILASDQKIYQIAQDDDDAQLSKITKVKKVWKLYLPPVASGVITVTCIVMANKISSKQIAALTVASGISERALKEYKDKVIEKLGATKDRAVRDEIAQDRINKYPPGSGEVILAGTGEVLCYDMTTGRYFQSTMEEIKRAENKINHDMLNHMGASLAEFHDLIGLPATNYTDSVGWNGTDLVKVLFSTTMSPDSRPCIAIDFDRAPVLEYSRLHG